MGNSTCCNHATLLLLVPLSGQYHVGLVSRVDQPVNRAFEHTDVSFASFFFFPGICIDPSQIPSTRRPGQVRPSCQLYICFLNDAPPEKEPLQSPITRLAGCSFTGIDDDQVRLLSQVQALAAAPLLWLPQRHTSQLRSRAAETRLHAGVAEIARKYGACRCC